MKVNVVICTHNRSDMLADTLSSWLDMSKPMPACGVEVELIVIDNASTDDTPDVVSACEDAIYHFESTPGLSHARNAGIAKADGELVAFVDDDIYFEKSWLLEVLAAFESHPEIDCLGGQSIPHFETNAPDWFGADAAKFYGSTSSGQEAHRMEYPEHPFGVNMVFRKKVFQEVGGFDPDLGRIGQSLLSNEEKDFFYRAKLEGCVVQYWPSAIIHHRIPAERVSRSWLLERSYWQGISDVVFDRIVCQPSRTTLLKKSLTSAFAVVRAQKRTIAKKLTNSSLRHQFVEQLQRERQRGILCQSLREVLSKGSNAAS